MNGSTLRRWVAFAAVLLLSLLAAMPGLLGDWVGDDFHMLTSRYYSDWTELPGVFTRHAGHYLGQEGTAGAAWPYRPVTMFTLLLSHLAVARPWLHHLVSWLLHLGTGAFVYIALMRQESPNARPSSGVVCFVTATLFLLHPVAVEAYVWINGRSDLLAGWCLAALAVVLSDQRMARHWRMLLIALLAFLGAGSKMPFIVAAVALWVGLSLRLRRPAGWHAGVPLFSGLGLYLVLRVIYAPLSGRIGAAESALEDASTWFAVPHLLAKSTEALVTFRAEAMQSLAWALHQPLSTGEWVSALVFSAAALGLGWRRDFGGLAYLAGFVLSVAPAAVVSQAIWLGFDRYLYMPSILLLLAGAPYVVAAVEARPRYRALWGVAAVALILVAALGTRAASLAYANQRAYERALITEHADDPTIFYYLARMARATGRPDLARETLATMPEPPWPRGLIMPVFALATELSDARVRDLAIEHGLEVYAENPYVRAHGMRWKYERGEVGEAMALARSFDAEDTLCPEIRRQLELWLRDADRNSQHGMIRQAANDLQCPADSP